VIMTMPSEPSGGRARRRPSPVLGYPPALIEEARELGRAGWQPMQVVRLFARRGVDPLPSAQAVRWWMKRVVNYEAAMEGQRRNKARENAERSGGRLKTRVSTPEFKLKRMQQLAELPGMSVAAITSVMGFDFDDGLSEHQVRHALATGRYPKRAVRAMEATR
jgi:hypothetical protein